MKNMSKSAQYIRMVGKKGGEREAVMEFIVEHFKPGEEFDTEDVAALYNHLRLPTEISDNLTRNEVVAILSDHRENWKGREYLGRDVWVVNTSPRKRGWTWFDTEPTVVVEPEEPKPNLGLATTQELIQELASRVAVSKIAGETWPDYKSQEDK